MKLYFRTKKTGISHFAAAVCYSYGGARRLFEETAARHEMIAYLSVTALFVLLGVGLQHYLTFMVLTLVTLGFEALNTAIEEIMDHVSQDYSTAAKHSKDLGSFAVFCLIISNSIFVGFVLIQTLTSGS